MRRLTYTGFALLAALLVITAAAAQTAPPTLPDEFSITTDPASLIGAYYNAINRGEFDRAYAYWEVPPNNQTLAQFIAGFADTVSAQVLVGVPYSMDAGAGNVYANVPTLLIANRLNDEQVYYAGCFTAHKTNVPIGNATEPDPNWYLNESDLVLMRDAETALASLTGNCAPRG